MRLPKAIICIIVMCTPRSNDVRSINAAFISMLFCLSIGDINRNKRYIKGSIKIVKLDVYIVIKPGKCQNVTSISTNHAVYILSKSCFVL